jgi:twinkle protein
MTTNKKSSVIGDMACPRCKKNGHDSTNNHLMVFSDGGMYCNKCGYHVHPQGKKQASYTSQLPQRREKPMDLSSFKDLPFKDLADRKIKASVCEYFGVTVTLSEVDKSITEHNYPIHQDGVLVGYKVRRLPKVFKTVGSCKGKTDLFGQNLASGGKRLLITGGELDAMSAYQMLKAKYPTYEPAVVSLPKGESAGAITDNLQWIEGFEEVIIYTDMDAPGRKCATEIAELIGPKAKIMSTSLKDASDMLKDDKQAEFINSYYTAKAYTPDGFVTVEDVFEEATAMPKWGRLYPWPSLNKLTYGRRDGEGIYVGAGVKCGKSSFIDQLVQHITIVEDRKVALFKMEEAPAMTVRKIAGLYMKKPFHKPDGNFTQAELIEGVNMVRDKVMMFDSYGSTSWDRLKGAIRHAVIAGGCKDVVIDPLTRLTVGMDSGEVNTELERVADELAAMAKDLGFFYVVCCHLKAPTQGKSHEMGGHVLTSQFAGSRAMSRACHMMLGIERNKDPELTEDERNTSTFVLLEDRAFGNVGSFQVFYNKESGAYLEPEAITSKF